MCFLCALRTGVIVAGLAVFVTIYLLDLGCTGILTESRQVDAVGTHVGDTSAFVESLCYHHGLAYGEAQFAGSLLLQCRSSERRRRSALQWLLAHCVDGKLCVHALLEEGINFFLGFEVLVELSLYFGCVAALIDEGKDGIHTEVWLTLEFLYLSLTFYDEANCNTLHTAGRKGRFHLTPKHG